MSGDPQYLNFDLLISREGAEFVARVTDSPIGQASTTFPPPLDGFEAQNLRLRVVRSKGVRSIDARSATAARDIGERLFRGAFRGDVHTCFASSRHIAEQQEKRLRIRLRLADPESAQLPWEYLRDPSSGGKPLGIDRDTPVVRYMELPSQPRRRRVDGPLRILAVISAPTDREGLNGDQEWANLERAVAPLLASGAVSLERLEPTTFSALERALVRNDYHIFHFVGHGGFDEQSGDGVLVFTKEDGTESWISSDQLGPILGDESSLQLVVLNACEGAVSEGRDIFAGCAQRLVGHGIPAVVAMQAEITDTAAVDFSARFYESLAAGLPVDAALTDGRKAIWVQPNPLEWGTPVLYMRSSDGRLFDVPAPTASAGRTARPEPARVPPPSVVPPPSAAPPPPRQVREPAPVLPAGAAASPQGEMSPALTSSGLHLPPPPDRLWSQVLPTTVASAPSASIPAPAPAPPMALWRKLLAAAGGTLILMTVLVQIVSPPRVAVDELPTFAPLVTAAATAAPATVAPLTPEAAATDLVDDYYFHLESGAYFEAWSLLSERWQQEQPYANFANGYRNTVETRFTPSRVTAIDPSFVHVAGTVIATERVSGGGLEEAVYRGTYFVRAISGRWRIDGADFSLFSRRRVG